MHRAFRVNAQERSVGTFDGSDGPGDQFLTPMGVALSAVFGFQ